MEDQPAQWVPKHVECRRWFVVFSNGYSEGHDWEFWEIFTSHRPGFRHVAAFCEPAPGVIFVVDPLRNYLLVDFAVGHVHEFIAPFWRKGATVLTIKRPVDPHTIQRIAPRNVVRGPLLTCASVLGYLFGLRRWIWTPYQLYRALLAVGAFELTEEAAREIYRHHGHGARDAEAGQDGQGGAERIPPGPAAA